MQFLQNILLVLQIIVCVALVAVILLQRSEGGALGMGGGGGGGLMTARGAGNLLTRTTAILAACFFVISVSLTILGNMQRSASLATHVGKIAPTAQPIYGQPAPQPATKTAPAPNPALGGGAPSSGSLGDLETGGPIALKQAGPSLSGAPAQPAQPAAKQPAAKAPAGKASKP
jgi:preprotein translocase subunit SecG